VNKGGQGSGLTGTATTWGCLDARPGAVEAQARHTRYDWCKRSLLRASAVLTATIGHMRYGAHLPVTWARLLQLRARQGAAKGVLRAVWRTRDGSCWGRSEFVERSV